MELTFAASALLGGLAVLSVPVIIHLLFRRRPRLAEFPALRFLAAGLRLQRTRIRLRYLLLLLLRMALLALLVLALARPLLRSRLFAPSAHRSARVVLILDDSYSMGYKADGTALLEKAKAEAGQLLSTLSLGSHAALLTTSRPLGDFTIDLEALRRQLADLPLTPSDVPAWTALEAANDLAQAEPDEPTEIYLFTDMTRQAWSAGGARPPHFAAATSLTVVDVGAPQAENVAVVAIDPPGATTAQNRTLDFSVTVRSQAVAGPRTLAFYVDGVRRADQALELTGDQRVTAQFRYDFRTPGVHQGWAEVVEGDGLLADNARYFTVVVGRLPCLLMVGAARPTRRGGVGATVQGAGDSQALGRDELFFARLAFNPGGFSQAAPFRLEETQAEEFTSFQRLGETYQVILLADVPELPAASWAELTRFVLTGGGLALFLGDRVDSANYNSQAADLLPGQVGPVVSFPQEARLFVPSFGHPLVAAFADGRNGDLTAPRFRAARQLTLFDNPEVELVATLETGEPGGSTPALAVRRLGQGLVACFTSSLDDAWTDFPKWPPYLPFLHELTKFLSRFQGQPHDFLAGGVARVNLAGIPLTGNPQFLLRRPADPAPLPIATLPTERSLVYTDTDQVGSYLIQAQLRPGPPGSGADQPPTQRGQAVSGFTVNLNPDEGDLTRVSADELTGLAPAPAVVRSIQELPAVWAEAGRGGTKELTPWLLLGLVLALVAETWFANRFYDS